MPKAIPLSKKYRFLIYEQDSCLWRDNQYTIVRTRARSIIGAKIGISSYLTRLESTTTIGCIQILDENNKWVLLTENKSLYKRRSRYANK